MGRKKIVSDEEIIKLFNIGLEYKEIAESLNISIWTVVKRLKNLNLKRNVKRYQDVSVFNKYTPESCYWAGFLAADGTAGKYSIQCELCLSDKPHLKKLKLFLNSNANIKERELVSFDKKIKSCYIIFYSIELANILKKNFNIVSNKSMILQPPKLPNNMIRHFIRGYFDGDGSIGWHKYNNTPRIFCCSGSEKMINWIYQNIKTNLKVGDPKISRRKKNLYAFSFMGKQSLNICKWLYKDSTIHLDRKYRRFLKYSSLVNYQNKEKLHIKQQKEKEYKFLELLYLFGMSIKDISIITNKTYGYVRYHINKRSIKLNKANGLYGQKNHRT